MTAFKAEGSSAQSASTSTEQFEGNVREAKKQGQAVDTTSTPQGETAFDSELHHLFDNFDKDHSGRIETEDLQYALEKLGLPYQSQRYLDTLKQQFHVDKDNSIDFERFKEYARRKESSVSASFSQLDIDGNGAITVGDLETALHHELLPVDYKEARRMIHLLDSDQNGYVSYEEFRAFCFLLPESQVNEKEILRSWVDSAGWVEGIEYNIAAVPPKPGFNRLVAGGIAGGVSKSVVAPFERLKIMMMTNSKHVSLRKTAKVMWQKEGLTGLFRGNLATVFKIIPQTATQFAVYDGIQDFMVRNARQKDSTTGVSDLSSLQHSVAGGLAGAAATLVTYPLETIRTHMSVCARLPMPTITAEIAAAAGLKGYYRGVHASLGNAVASNALGFAAYEYVTLQYKKMSGNHSPSPYIKGACAGLSACAVMGIVMPLENVQRRLQVQGRDGYPVIYHGTWDCMKRMYSAEGLQAFWKGSMSSFLKVAPSLAAVRVVYEVVMRSNMGGGIHQYRDETPTEQPSNAAHSLL